MASINHSANRAGLEGLCAAVVPVDWPDEARRLANDLQYRARLLLDEMKTLEQVVCENRDAWYEKIADVHAQAAVDRAIERLGLQVGWWHPAEKRFCYEDQKKVQLGSHKGYVVPVYAIKHEPETR